MHVLVTEKRGVRDAGDGHVRKLGAEACVKARLTLSSARD